MYYMNGLIGVQGSLTLHLQMLLVIPNPNNISITISIMAMLHTAIAPNKGIAIANIQYLSFLLFICSITKTC
jgi:hypothetical protein